MRETAATAIAVVLIEEDVDLTVQGNSKDNCELLLLVESQGSEAEMIYTSSSLVVLPSVFEILGPALKEKVHYVTERLTMVSTCQEFDLSDKHPLNGRIIQEIH